jgi:hypothetical protein
VLGREWWGAREAAHHVGEIRESRSKQMTRMDKVGVGKGCNTGDRAGITWPMLGLNSFVGCLLLCAHPADLLYCSAC